MEDRLTPGLWLEMTDEDPAAYATGRASEVLDLPGVTAASSWANANRGRHDLPRHLPEFSLLAVYEVDDEFTPPRPPADVGGHYFRRTSRPGQGRLTGGATLGLSLVLISPRSPDQAQALRDWGDFVHIRHIVDAAVPGYTMITPYERADGGDPRFLHLYEMDTEDPETAFKAMTPLVAGRLGQPGTDAFDRWARHPALRIMYVNSFCRLGRAD